MPTKFAALISGKAFPAVFFMLCLLLTAFTSHVTVRACASLLLPPWICTLIYVLFAGNMLLMLYQRKWHSHFLCKALGFLRCFVIYYILWFFPCLIVALLPFVSNTIGALCILFSFPASLLTVVIGYQNTRTVVTTQYDLTLKENGKPYRIALLSDIYLGHFVRGDHIKKVIKQVRQISPDIVVISGDLFDVSNSILEEKAVLKEISHLFRKLKARNGVFAVLGNHDPRADDPRLKHFLKEANIRLLDDETVEMADIILIGRTDNGNNKRSNWDDLAIPSSQKPMIVLDHKPQGIDEAAQHGAALVLSGHTHQGQFFPITILTKLANGKQYFYGQRKLQKTYGITTSGVGFFELPMRLGTRNEIVDIRLKL